MNRSLGFFLGLILLFLLMPAVSLAGGSEYVVNNPAPDDRLHLRLEPMESGISLGRYYNGTRVTLLEDCGDWLRVRIGGEKGAMEGYMLRKYLTTGSVESAMPEYVSLSSAWELYDQPSLQGIYRMCGYGEEILLMGFSNNWHHITTRDGRLTGFVPASKNCLVSPFPAMVNNPDPADRLNLRIKPNRAAESLGKYYNGVTVTVLGAYVDNQWLRVRLGALEGYMDAKYLAFDQDIKTVTRAMPNVTIDAPEGVELHLREVPSVNAISLESYSTGTHFTVMGVNGDWAHVLTDSREGFVLSRYLTSALRK